jgi:hypothetical protein
MRPVSWRQHVIFAPLFFIILIDTFQGSEYSYVR